MSGDAKMQMSNGHHWDMQDDLVDVDPDMHAIILREKDRQKRGNHILR